MSKSVIGFSNGIPESRETKWEKPLGSGFVIYRKLRVGERGDFFIYNCEWHRSKYSSGSTSWQTHEDLSPTAVEQLPRFLDFLSEKF